MIKINRPELLEMLQQEAESAGPQIIFRTFICLAFRFEMILN